MSEQQQAVVSDRTEQSFNQESFIAIRLDTDKILRRLEFFLSSTKIIVKQDPESGMMFEERVVVGKPLCNEQGLNGLLQIVEMMINGQVVQGNFDNPKYSDYIYFTRRELACEIIVNRIKWGIAPEHAKMIIDCIMRFVKPFLSRLINNEERKSYIGGFQSREVVMHGEKSGLSKFGSGFGK